MDTLLPVLFGLIIVGGVTIYVILDGFDLGVGILFAFAPDRDARDIMMNSIAPVWDGNETWLVLGGVILMAAFPAAYAVALTAFYLPVILLLIALIFRGVAFEFRMKATESKFFWSGAFFLGSAAAAFFQGVLLGALVQGVEVEGNRFAGGSFDWASPFSVLTGLGVLSGYALLGAGWLNIKTEGALQSWVRRLLRPLLLAVLIFMGLVSVSTPFLRPEIAERWFSHSQLLLLWPVPIMTAVLAGMLWSNIDSDREHRPFLLTVGLFIMGFIGLLVSLWPYIVPPAYTLWEAAAPTNSLAFTLVATLLTLPMVGFYTWYAYRVFQGKVTADDGYSH